MIPSSCASYSPLAVTDPEPPDPSASNDALTLTDFGAPGLLAPTLTDLQAPDPSASDFPLTLTYPPAAETPTASHRRTAENKTKVWVWATMPLILHFVFVITLVDFIAFYVNGQDFNLQSRHSLPRFTPLQSDITTSISSWIAVYRFFAAMWSTAMLWRCIFILMGKCGITLEQIDSLLTWQIHIRPRLRSSQGFGLLVSIILLAAFPSQLSGPILTGSITWSSSRRFIKGPEISDIFMGWPGGWSSPSLNDLYSPSVIPNLYANRNKAFGFASTAWVGSPEDIQTMKRVIPEIGHLPINCTLNNVTIPYFSVTKIEWIIDPKKELADTGALSFMNNSTSNPFNRLSKPGTFALIPDTWGNVTLPSSYTGTISETRIVVGVYRFFRISPFDGPFGDLPDNITCIAIPNLYGCQIFGRVTYEAGAAECRNCRISSRATVQNDTALTVTPSAETLLAVGLMPMVGGMMADNNISLPHAHNNLDGYVTELLIRSYAASWTYLAQTTSFRVSTGVQIPIQTSRATVLWWRVGLWLLLNLLFTLSGILFLFTQKKSGERLVGNPPLAALLLDTTKVLHEGDRAFCDFTILTKEDESIGYLRLTRNWAEGGHRQVEIVKK